MVEIRALKSPYNLFSTFTLGYSGQWLIIRLMTTAQWNVNVFDRKSKLFHVKSFDFRFISFSGEFMNKSNKLLADWYKYHQTLNIYVK